MNRKEAVRQYHQEEALTALGFTTDEARELRRISMTLRRWFELECGTGSENVTLSIERDGEEPDSKPYMRVQYATAHGYVDNRWPIPDRETGARKRLAKILEARNARHYVQGTNYYGLRADTLYAYVQMDPRGAALYILRPGDVPEGEDVSSYYTRGICVC